MAYTIIWTESEETNGKKEKKSAWDRAETAEEVIKTLYDLKTNPNVYYDDIWVFKPIADDFAHCVNDVDDIRHVLDDFERWTNFDDDISNMIDALNTKDNTTKTETEDS